MQSKVAENPNAYQDHIIDWVNFTDGLRLLPCIILELFKKRT